ncbi:hypothetical protein [Algibacter lectus]|uniref:Uncharacterized protein n=2 Tax=Algibacter lectus TaxID=221126 RepID=A0A090W3D1_9FLAO|nr:hypothetical protein [Algibacter lectus]MWW23806.1 hypothetical protein [Algibacter lectus]TDY63510.1 hypothetical protein DFQ06_0398 [Algibacter lectus]GAL62017.1 hypothetical protein JCM19300_763 [Algibacter lectus]SFC43980.1 hypothetical protein SAMN04489722_102428 [Algibacter lectus]
MQLKRTYLFILGLILLSSFTSIHSNTASIKLLTSQTDYIVGTNVVLEFSTTDAVQPMLYCSNSYGSTLISPTLENKKLRYQIPANIYKKVGVVNWSLIYKSNTLSGVFHMVPKPEVATMETYIGPPSIEAGGKDYTMLVIIPTDSLDNPVPKNTTVNAKHQFLASEEVDNIVTNNLIAFKNIYSKKESGRMLISSECLNINSKEFTINVMPAVPVDFEISAHRPHNYADGNQVTTFSTTIIKDKQDNVVSDGTFVIFYITNKSGNILKTSGTTLDGIATAKIIHPDYGDNWSIKAYVEGMSESNTITIAYTQVIEDFIVEFSKDGRDINVGPLQSFMQQMIPDGLQVKLLVYKNDILLEKYTKTSVDGYAHFYLKSDIFKPDNYNIKIQTAGLEKTFNNTKLW